LRNRPLEPEGDWATAPVAQAKTMRSSGAVAQSSPWTEPVRGSDGARPDALALGAMGKKAVTERATDTSWAIASTGVALAEDGTRREGR